MVRGDRCPLVLVSVSFINSFGIGARVHVSFAANLFINCLSAIRAEDYFLNPAKSPPIQIGPIGYRERAIVRAGTNERVFHCRTKSVTPTGAKDYPAGACGFG
jgi:hypothetical protein